MDTCFSPLYRIGNVSDLIISTIFQQLIDIQIGSFHILLYQSSNTNIFMSYNTL